MAYAHSRAVHREDKFVLMFRQGHSAIMNLAIVIWTDADHVHLISNTSTFDVVAELGLNFGRRTGILMSHALEGLRVGWGGEDDDVLMIEFFRFSDHTREAAGQ